MKQRRPYKKIPVADRFWPKVSKTDDCWNWIGALDQHGYGRLNVNGKSEKATRVAWSICNGSWPSMQILHTCDNPGCVRFDHLYQGMPADNARDMTERRRHWSFRNPDDHLAHMRRMRRCVNPLNHSGEKSHRAKLTWGIIRTIRTSSESGVKLAGQYFVTTTTICDIRKGRTWVTASGN